MDGPVICGIDGSPASAGAIEVARGLADRYALPLRYVHVADGVAGEQRASAALRDAVVGGDGELVFEEGHPADRLVALAAEVEASFLVVGSHGPRSSLLGSVSADVSRRAPCPVLVVPPGARLTGTARAEAEPGADGGIDRFGLAGRVG